MAMNKIFDRKSIRLKRYDYSSTGYYFITICTQGKKEWFGKIQMAEMRLKEYGEIAQRIWGGIPEHFSNIELDEFVIMPNHMHGVIVIVGAEFPRPGQRLLKTDNLYKVPVGAGFPRPGQGLPNTDNHYKGRGDLAPTLGQIVAYFKYVTTKQINLIGKTPGIRLWQRNYYEHVIRDYKDLADIREYIVNNPVKWQEDEYYV